MSETKFLTPGMDYPPVSVEKKAILYTAPNHCKIKDALPNKEKILEVNIKSEILSHIIEKRETSMNLFPSRPLMGYHWYKWEDRGQDITSTPDRLYRNMKNTPPSIYSSYSLDSSPGQLDPTKYKRNSHFPSLISNVKGLDTKDTIASYNNSESTNTPLPMLSQFPASAGVLDHKGGKRPKRVEKWKRLPFSDNNVQRFSKGSSRKRERNLSSSKTVAERLENNTSDNDFWVKGHGLRQETQPYMPRSFSISHNEYMAHFQSFSDESDNDED